MPKDEVDPEDPMELHGLAFPGDTTDEMAECLVEEYALQGFGDQEILDLFRRPCYSGTHRIYAARGEPYVRELIARVRARWGGVRFRTETPEARSFEV